MSMFNLKTAALAIVAGVGLSGCAYGPYGGLGVGVGYGNGYGPYYGGYGYYSGGYGYPSGSGYGYGYPYGYRLWISYGTARPTTAGTTAIIIRAPATTCTTATAGASLERRAAALLGTAAQRRHVHRRRVAGHRRIGPTSRIGRSRQQRPSVSAASTVVSASSASVRSPAAASPYRAAGRSVGSAGAARSPRRGSAGARRHSRPEPPRSNGLTKQPGRHQPLGSAYVQPSVGRRRISTIEVKLITGTPSWLVTVVSRPERADLRLRARRRLLDDLAAHGQRVAGIDRLQPAQLVDARVSRGPPARRRRRGARSPPWSSRRCASRSPRSARNGSWPLPRRDRWNGCGSYLRANSSTSSRVTS